MKTVDVKEVVKRNTAIDPDTLDRHLDLVDRLREQGILAKPKYKIDTSWAGPQLVRVRVDPSAEKESPEPS